MFLILLVSKHPPFPYQQGHLSGSQTTHPSGAACEPDRNNAKIIASHSMIVW